MSVLKRVVTLSISLLLLIGLIPSFVNAEDTDSNPTSEQILWEQKMFQKSYPDQFNISRLSTTKTKLTWRKYRTSIFNPSSNTMYEIYRSNKRNSGYKRIAIISGKVLNDPDPMKTDRGRILYWIDTTCKKSKEYYYKLRAYRIVNGTKFFSEYTEKYYAFRDYKSLKKYGYIIRNLDYKNFIDGYQGTSYFGWWIGSGYGLISEELVELATDGNSMVTDGSLSSRFCKWYNTEYAKINSSSKPVQIKNFQVTKLSTNKAELWWKKLNDADGYIIYRSNNKNRGFKKLRSIKNVDSSVYVDKTIKESKTYYYKIRAYKTINNKRIYGKYSSVKKL